MLLLLSFPSQITDRNLPKCSLSIQTAFIIFEQRLWVPLLVAFDTGQPPPGGIKCKKKTRLNLIPGAAYLARCQKKQGRTHLRTSLTARAVCVLLCMCFCQKDSRHHTRLLQGFIEVCVRSRDHRPQSVVSASLSHAAGRCTLGRSSRPAQHRAVTRA